MRIGVVATGGTLDRAVVEPVRAAAAALDPAIRIDFHEQCFKSHGHFAGSDDEREDAFVAYANDDVHDAVWFGRGGYGTCRIAERAVARLEARARGKLYLGYSDAGCLLAGLYKEGFEGAAHGPMPGDVLTKGIEPVARALRWLARRDPAALEPSLGRSPPAVAFNMVVFSQLLGTPLEPDLAGHVLMLEEVDEPMYRIDRTLFHITSQASIRGVAGIRLGRCDPIVPNRPDFRAGAEEVARFWCDRAGIRWLGRADIGHDSANKVVPFGRR